VKSYISFMVKNICICRIILFVLYFCLLSFHNRIRAISYKNRLLYRVNFFSFVFFFGHYTLVTFSYEVIKINFIIILLVNLKFQRYVFQRRISTILFSFMFHLLYLLRIKFSVMVSHVFNRDRIQVFH
jgi:hypothetical protein